MGNYYRYSIPVDLPTFGSILAIHKDTLQTLDIGYSSFCGPGVLFDFATTFPCLEVLRLSQSAVLLEADLLLGPKLRKFGWVFILSGFTCKDWTQLGSREEGWLRGFTKAAISKRPALKKIEIKFTPEHWGSAEEDGYPWDRIDKIKDEIDLTAY